MANGAVKRRHLFAALTILLLILVAELGSFALLSLLLRHPVGWRELAERRQAVGGETARAAAPAEPRPEVARTDLTANVLHPFLGFVRDPAAGPPAAGAARKAVELGFHPSAGCFFEEPDAERLVVGVFGGSVADRFAATAAADLGEALRASGVAAGREVLVGSAAHGGYKQPQQLQALSYLLANGAHFDLVINIDGFNEVALPPAELIDKGVWPFYPRDWYWRVARLEPAERFAVGLASYLRIRRRELAELFSRPGLRLSLTAGLVWHLLDTRLAQRGAKVEASLWSGGGLDDSYQTLGPALGATGSEELYRELARVWWRSSVQMERLCSANGVEYFHFLQPNQYVEGSKTLSAEERRVAFHPKHPYRPGVVLGYPELRRQAAAAAAAGVALHDLTRLFEGVERTLYVDSCCHFNADGNRILAERIAREIAERRGEAVGADADAGRR